ASRRAAAGIAETSLRIGGMHCATCAGVIEQALQRVPGLLAAQVNAASGLGSVRWDRARTTLEQLLQAVADAGYSASVERGGSARHQRMREARPARLRLCVRGRCAVPGR